jgi:very-short-patch-repair endonuclease
VLRSTSAPVTDRQRALAAVLEAGEGAALSHESGTALWGVPGFELLPADVLRPRMSNRRRLRLGRSHWATLLPADLVTVYDGIPVVRPSYLALLLFGSIHPQRARRATSTMLARRLTTLGALESVLERMAIQGRDGIVAFREYLDEERRRGHTFDSGLERRFDWLLASHGEKQMRAQVDIGEDSWVGRVDFLDADVPLIVEIDSELHHSALVDAEADARRTAALEAAGYTIQRFTDVDVWHRGDHVVAEVRRLRHELRRRAQAA